MQNDISGTDGALAPCMISSSSARSRSGPMLWISSIVRGDRLWK